MNESFHQGHTSSFMRNPFTVKSPEELNREQIVQLFVQKYTKIEIIKEKKHTLIWGARGSGKSMMLRYLEPLCKSIVHGSLNAFLEKDDSFIGVYCPCKEGQLNKTELSLLEPSPRMVIAEHLMNLSVSRQILRCLGEQFPTELFQSKDVTGYAKHVLALFDKASIASSASQADDNADRQQDPFNWLNNLLEAEIAKISRFLRELALSTESARYNAATTGYHDFLLPFVIATRRLFRESSAPVYVLLDDADHLQPLQQHIVNTWMANRDHQELCIKVSSRREGYCRSKRVTVLRSRSLMITQL